MLNTQGDISWDNRERAAQMHYICGIQLDCEPDDNTIKEVAWTKDVQIIGKQQLHHMDHRVLAKTFMVWVWFNVPDLAELPDKFLCMLRNIEMCGVFAQPMYDTTLSQPHLKINK